MADASKEDLLHDLRNQLQVAMLKGDTKEEERLRAEIEKLEAEE